MANHSRLYVGIDIHRKSHRVALIPLGMLDNAGALWKKIPLLTIGNNSADFERLQKNISSHIFAPDEANIAIDHTGGHYSEPLVYFLQSHGYKVCYLETKAVKAARERLLDQESKSDTIDAIGAAYLLFLRDTHGITFRISAMAYELSTSAAILKTLVMQRWLINKLIIQATNRLHQFLLAVFPEGENRYFEQLLKITPTFPTPKDILASNGLKSVQRITPKTRENVIDLASKTVGIPGDKYQWLIKELSQQRMDLVAKRDQLTEMIRKELLSHPYGQILLSFPQVGEIAAATIISIVKDIERWPDKKKFKKALGVYNSITQSGGGPGKTRHGKEGSRDGRRVLFQVCLGCITPQAPENDFRDYYSHHVLAGKPRMKALVAAMGKLAEIIYHCLRFGETYQYQGRYK